MGISAKSVAGVLRAVAGKSHPKNYTSAVIAAGGSSRRMGGDTPKQFFTLLGTPILVHTLKAFEKCDDIDEIIIVSLKDEIPTCEALCTEYKINKLRAVVAGGSTRQESVRAGLDAVRDISKYIAISDAARCLVTPEIISTVCHRAYEFGAACASTRVHDSIKTGDKSAFVESSVDRNRAFLAQTPQVFKTAEYRAAAYYARDDRFEGTDDVSLMEHIGIPVKLVECGKENMKITEKSDLLYAEAVLRSRLTESEEDGK